MAVITSSVAGIVAGRNPLNYDPANPQTIFLFQAIFIIVFCQILHIPLSFIRQPKVIAEVISGIILGPSVFGKIHNYTTTIFPPASVPGLALVANIGLILFLFIVGLEVDIKFIKKNLRVALTVGLASMALPFGLGAAVSVGLYNEYAAESGVKFSTFLVFISVAMCITAFPVLARILTELNLLKDNVGTIVLAAGITNDLVGWMLLALSVTLANAGSGVQTVYILLLIVGWFLFLMFPVKYALRWALVRTNDLEKGPSQFSTMVIIVMVYISAFFTDIIGVHPIFGAFLMGIIVPREHDYVIRLTEKIEDLVNVTFIPLYFALAGLRCNLGLLNKGIDWAYIVGIIVIAMVGKIVAGTIAARFNKLFWRESLSVGVLMSCKGIVEIVVLTTGLNAGIISQKVFSMFIVMALITTFLTSPLTLIVYPVWYREKVSSFRRGEIHWDGTPIQAKGQLDEFTIDSFANFRITRLLPVIESLDSITDLIDFLHYFVPVGESSKVPAESLNYTIPVHGVHLKRLSQRTADVLQASTEYDDESPKHHDPLLLTLKIFSELNGTAFTSRSKLTTTEERINTICDLTSVPTDMVLVPYKGRNLLNSNKGNKLAELNQLFVSAKNQLGVFIENKNSTKSSGVLESNNSDESSITSEDIDFLQSGYAAINLILTGSNLGNDLLALHIFLKLVSQRGKLSKFRIFVKVSGVSDKELLVSLIQEYKNSLSSEVEFYEIEEVDGAKFISTIFEEFLNEQDKDSSIALETNLFLSGASGNDETESLGDDVRQLIDESITEKFNVLLTSSK